jgi:FAD/FMN-containing dehydrogenase
MVTRLGRRVERLPAWPHFLRLKARYDPRQVLPPGQGIFPA